MYIIEIGRCYGISYGKDEVQNETGCVKDDVGDDMKRLAAVNRTEWEDKIVHCLQRVDDWFVYQIYIQLLP